MLSPAQILVYYADFTVIFAYMLFVNKQLLNSDFDHIVLP